VGLAQNPDSLLELDWEQKLPNFYYNIETRKASDQTGLRANLSGSVAFLNSQLRATRDIEEAFVMIKVADFAGIRVYSENQLVGKTDDTGHLLIPGMRPYDINKLRIEPKDLPLEAEIDALDTVVTPYKNSGVLVEFAIKRSVNYNFIATTEDGEIIPAGAEVYISTDVTAETGEEEFASVVGFEGLVYLTTQDTITSIDIKWPEQHCKMQYSEAELEQVISIEAEIAELSCIKQ